MGVLFKWVVALTLMAAGGLYLAQGIGIHTFLAQSDKSYELGIPVGVGLFAAGVALAALWKVEKTISRDALERSQSMDGIENGTKVIVKVERRAKNPK